MFSCVLLLQSANKCSCLAFLRHMQALNHITQKLPRENRKKRKREKTTPRVPLLFVRDSVTQPEGKPTTQKTSRKPKTTIPICGGEYLVQPPKLFFGLIKVLCICLVSRSAVVFCFLTLSRTKTNKLEVVFGEGQISTNQNKSGFLFL